ncbi:MAG: hypothetical protein M1834_002206 [Cirrosporium novae-zelandiae]|nr:MAG: hypothetical protein M1834_002206 [Cirrosporium novae-zelandiae]
MPGILPMKVIKVGTSNQSRIAQACDRCRSKKIRCDGIRPCCSQCANVGFECKTSDKLSRRAFPRGYTESLEDRVRGLESEVRELKALLDEKDEKIDLLSKIHAFTPPERRATLSPHSTHRNTPSPQEDSFQVQQSPSLAPDCKSEPCFIGASSGRAFVDAFKYKLEQNGKSCSDLTVNTFFASENQQANREMHSSPVSLKTPPRLLSDQLVNIFFQEWAPLFPVLHRPTFLKLYEDFVKSPEDLEGDVHAIAQLNLVFGIAALSKNTCSKEDILLFEKQWHSAVNAAKSEKSLATLQCLILAQIYCICSHDYHTLLDYKGLAVLLCHRLGLNQSQKRFQLGALTRETRKRVFWAGYTIDRFSAAVLGVPVLLREDDVHTEYPADIDDECVTEKGFLPTLPGESTKLSNALALFRATRILTHVLEQNYPASVSYELSLQRIISLNEELDTWLQGLAPHLRLEFVQDKPSTNVIGSRSPLLSLAYFYIRTLIHRPALGSGLGSKASPSLVALADSSKHIIQIVQLLEERQMSFSFCLNKSELLMLSGFGLLYQGLELDMEGKLIKDNQRLVCSVIDILQRESAPGASEFKKMACALISVDRSTKGPKGSSPRRLSNGSVSSEPAGRSNDKSTRKQLQAIAARLTAGGKSIKQEDHDRRSTVPKISTANLMPLARNNSVVSISSARSEPAIPVQQKRPIHPPRLSQSPIIHTEMPNLDYYPLNDQSPLPSYPSTNYGKTVPAADWEKLLGVLDGGTTNIYDGIYGGPSPEVISSFATPTTSFPTSTYQDCNFDTWSPKHEFNSGQLYPPAAQSVLSFSDESLTSGGEELSVNSSGSESGYKGIIMPNLVDDFGLEPLDGSGFGL